MYEPNDKVETDQLAVSQLGFVKAFDTVPHEILIQKIGNFRTCGKLFSMITSYLTDRRRWYREHPVYLRSNDAWGPTGVYLGSSPLLTVKDLPESLGEVDGFSYAGDLKVIIRLPFQLDFSTVNTEYLLKASKLMPNIGKLTLLNLRGDKSLP